MTQYKFRAECSTDIVNFFRLIPEQKYDNIHIGLLDNDESIPDRECSFFTNCKLSGLIKYAKRVVDGHVIAQTIRPKERYTGERNYEI